MYIYTPMCPCSIYIEHNSLNARRDILVKPLPKL